MTVRTNLSVALFMIAGLSTAKPQSRANTAQVLKRTEYAAVALVTRGELSALAGGAPFGFKGAVLDLSFERIHKNLQRPNGVDQGQSPIS